MEDIFEEIYIPYEVPKEIRKLHGLEEALHKEDLSLEIIGFRPSISLRSAYEITPPDVIPFAETGGNGIHFGFLTDFGLVKDLKDAPIVCVSPTNDPPIRYMARNITEFLNLASSVPHVEMLEQFWSYDHETQIQEHIQEFHKDAPTNWEKKRQAVLARFQETFHAQLEKILPYFHEVQIERKRLVDISTLDGLGVIGESCTEENRSYSFDYSNSLDEKELQRMQNFLNQANRLEKLAFIRDANYRYIAAPSYDKAILDLMIDLLQSMDLHAEAQNLLARE